MSEEPHADEPDQQGSVFGNLPGSRPGTRSPRRDRGSRGEPKAAARATEAAARKRPAAPAAETPAAEPAGEAGEAAATQAPSGGGLEDLAWAGVAAAAEAATIGVRLASRAIEALRDGVDRR